MGRKEIHGGASSGKTPTYRCWLGIKKRCCNLKEPAYYKYGGRGIIVCERWINSFENFLADVGERPSSLHSLDRIDNDGNYEPGNVRWATSSEQARNRRSNHILSVGGVEKPMIEWCEQYKARYDRVIQRIRLGWTPYLALTMPPDNVKLRIAIKKQFPISYSFGVIST